MKFSQPSKFIDISNSTTLGHILVLGLLLVLVSCRNSDLMHEITIKLSADNYIEITPDSSHKYFSQNFPEISFIELDSSIFWLGKSGIPRVILFSKNGSVSNVHFCNKYFPGLAESLNEDKYSIDNKNWLKQSELNELIKHTSTDTSLAVFLETHYGDFNKLIIEDLKKVKTSIAVIYFNTDLINPPLDSLQKKHLYLTQRGTRDFFPE
jgi:hypothetical protein